MKGINIIRLSVSYKALYYQEKSPVFQVPKLQELINHGLQGKIQPWCNSVVGIHLFHASACIFVCARILYLYYHRTFVQLLHEAITVSTITTLYTSIPCYFGFYLMSCFHFTWGVFLPGGNDWEKRRIWKARNQRSDKKYIRAQWIIRN